MRTVFFSFCFLLFVCWSSLLTAKESQVFFLQGYVDKGQIEPVAAYLKQEGALKELILHLNSSSADMKEMVSFAELIYEKKELAQLHVTAFIESKAIGAVAMIPFMADELYTTPVMLWGDITKGSESIYSKSVLQGLLHNLISDENPHQEMLKMLSSAMIDGSLALAQEGGKWRLVQKEHNEPLVLNQKDLGLYGLSTSILTASEFNAKYKTNEIPKESVPTENIPSVDELLARSIHVQPQGQNFIGYLHLSKDRGIDESTYLYVKFALDRFKEQNVSFVILDLDTPGGEVMAALKISDLLKKLDAQDHIPVVAFIDNWALSAGALLAYSCRFIGIEKGSSMGAAEPVLMGEQGKMESASEKINSALRAEFSNTASYYGRNPLIAKAMVDKDIILVERHGDIIQLDLESEIISTGEYPDIVITTKGKLLTLDAKQLLEFHVADFSLETPSNSNLSKAERKTTIAPAGSYPLFQEPFFSHISDPVLIGFQDWKIDFFAFLSHPMVSSLLMMGLIIGIYGEMNHPGFGFFGALALVCLGLILLSSFALQTIGWLDVILLTVGLVLVAIEVFALPTFGVVGILGLVLTIAGLSLLLLPHLPNVSFSSDLNSWSLSAIELVNRIGWLLGALLLSLLVMALLTRYISLKGGMWKRFVLKGEQNRDEGFVAGLNHKDLPPVGKEGIAFTSLRPSGKVLIDDLLYEAQAQAGSFIEQDEKIVVIAQELGKLIVASAK